MLIWVPNCRTRFWSKRTTRAVVLSCLALGLNNQAQIFSFLSLLSDRLPKPHIVASKHSPKEILVQWPPFLKLWKMSIFFSSHKGILAFLRKILTVEPGSTSVTKQLCLSFSKTMQHTPRDCNMASIPVLSPPSNLQGKYAQVRSHCRSL